MNRLLLAPGLALLAGCITELPDVANPCAPWKDPGIYDLTIEAGGKTRRSFIYVPPNSAGPRDLVVVLHGGGSSGRTTAEVTEYIGVAKNNGFIAAFPDATDPLLGRSAWNAGDCCLSADEKQRDIDDVEFLDKLVAELQKKTCTDRTLATGFSNGSMMAHRWACQRDTVDVVVPVGGTPAVTRCNGDPMPVRHYHGTADPVVPIDGGGGTSEKFPSLDEAMQIWLDRNQCVDTDNPELVEDGILTCEIYDCAAPTEICLLDGWKHQWPGGVYKGELGGINVSVDGYQFFLDNAPPREDTGTGPTTPSGTGSAR